MPFLFDESAQRYRDQPSGRFVSPRAIDAAVDQVIQTGADHMLVMTQQLQLGNVSLADWQQGMAAEMKLLHTGAAALGNGGWSQMTQADWGWTGQQIRAQYAYLRNFAHDIASGKQPMDGRLLARAAMYADAARATGKNMQRRAGILAGHTMERNILGVAEQHCPDCPSLSAMGWVPIGTLTPIGGRSCRSRCVCTIMTREHTGLLAA